jgi:hypothetical protein
MRSIRATMPLLAAALLASSPAAAEESRRYGWQILIADVASVGTLFAGSAAHEGLAVGVGAFSYIAVSPAIHLAHGEVGRGLGSLGLRLALPLAGMYVGSAASAGELDGAGAGMLAGVATATLLDAAFLARESRRRETPAVAVGVALGEGTVSAAIAGRF